MQNAKDQWKMQNEKAKFKMNFQKFFLKKMLKKNSKKISQQKSLFLVKIKTGSGQTSYVKYTILD